MSPINKCTFLKSVGMSLWVLARFWKWQDPSCLLEATRGYKTRTWSLSLLVVDVLSPQDIVTMLYTKWEALMNHL